MSAKQNNDLREKSLDILALIEQHVNFDLDDPVTKPFTPEKLSSLFTLDLNTKPESWKKTITDIENYFKYAVNTQHPLFSNQLWSGFSLPGFLAEMVINATNTSMYTYEVAPIATLIEKTLIDEMLKHADFPEGEGIFTTGGTASNISAILAARNSYDPHIIDTGVGAHQFVIFASSAAHYSTIKAANIIGIGTDNVIKVPTDQNDKMIPDALDKAIQTAKTQGKTPLIVIATAGTTVAGTYDPIDQISQICSKDKIWLHVDGAWGGAVFLHPEHKDKMKGLNLADSYSWNAHKMLGIPLVCSVLMTKKKGHLALAHAHGNSDDYLFHEHDAMQYDLGKKSIQCGRRFDSLKLWLAWKMMGLEGIQKHLDHLYTLTDYFTDQVKSHDHLELVSIPETPSVCFRYMPEHQTKLSLDDFNIALREALIATGLCQINYGRVDGKIVIRLVIANPALETEHLDYFINLVLETAHKLDHNNLELKTA